MPSFVRPLAVTAPLGNWTDVALLECHDYAPLFSTLLHGLSAEYGDRDGWVDARYAAPGAILRTLGPVAQAMRLTKPQAAAVLDALAAHGHLERSEAGAVRMAGYADLVERSSAAAVRNANSARQREIHQRKIKHLADKPVLTVGPSTLTVEASTLPQAPATLTAEPAAGHDAPAGSTYDQDRHYLGIPSGCSKKEGEEEGEGGMGEGEPVRLPPPRLALVHPEPAPPPLPKGHRRPKPPLRTKHATIDEANRVLPPDEHHHAWLAFGYIMDARWTIGGIEHRPCWEIPGFDAVRIAQKLGAPQYDTVPKDEIVRACDRLDVARDTKSDLGLYLLGWFNRELKFQAERAARYGGAR